MTTIASLLLTTAPGAMLPGAAPASAGAAGAGGDFLKLVLPGCGDGIALGVPGTGGRQDLAGRGTGLPLVDAHLLAADLSGAEPPRTDLPHADLSGGDAALAWLADATGVEVPPAPTPAAVPEAPTLMRTAIDGEVRAPRPRLVLPDVPVQRPFADTALVADAVHTDPAATTGEADDDAPGELSAQPQPPLQAPPLPPSVPQPVTVAQHADAVPVSSGRLLPPTVPAAASPTTGEILQTAAVPEASVPVAAADESMPKAAPSPMPAMAGEKPPVGAPAPAPMPATQAEAGPAVADGARRDPATPPLTLSRDAAAAIVEAHPGRSGAVDRSTASPRRNEGPGEPPLGAEEATPQPATALPTPPNVSGGRDSAAPVAPAAAAPATGDRFAGPPTARTPAAARAAAPTVATPPSTPARPDTPPATSAASTVLPEQPAAVTVEFPAVASSAVATAASSALPDASPAPVAEPNAAPPRAATPLPAAAAAAQPGSARAPEPVPEAAPPLPPIVETMPGAASVRTERRAPVDPAAAARSAPAPAVPHALPVDPVIASTAPVRVDAPVAAAAAVVAPPAAPSAAVPPAAPAAAPIVATPATPTPAAAPVEAAHEAARPVVTAPPARPDAAANAAPAPVIASAARTFAEAIHRAVAGEERARPADPSTPIGAQAATAAISPAAVAATGQPQQQTLDMRQPNWPGAMIQHIEKLRDMADANDMRIRVVPDALGAIDVALRREGDTVQVQLTAEQPQTRALLAEAQPRLTDMAEARGLKLQHHAGGTAGGGNGGATPQGDRQPPQQQRAAPLPSAPPSARRSPAAGADDTDQRLA